MKQLFVIALCLILVSCSKTSKEDVFSELAKKEGYWKLAGADSFMDGGSFCLSFISQTGELLHVVVLSNIRRSNGNLVFELWRSYRETEKKVIDPGSDLEKQVLWLLDNYQNRPEIVISREYSAAMTHAMKHRSSAVPFGEEFEKSQKQKKSNQTVEPTR